MIILNYGGSGSEKVEESPIKETVSQIIRVNRIAERNIKTA